MAQRLPVGGAQDEHVAAGQLDPPQRDVEQRGGELALVDAPQRREPLGQRGADRGQCAIAAHPAIVAPARTRPGAGGPAAGRRRPRRCAGHAPCPMHVVVAVGRCPLRLEAGEVRPLGSKRFTEVVRVAVHQPPGERESRSSRKFVNRPRGRSGGSRRAGRIGLVEARVGLVKHPAAAVAAFERLRASVWRRVPPRPDRATSPLVVVEPTRAASRSTRPPATVLVRSGLTLDRRRPGGAV